MAMTGINADIEIRRRKSSPADPRAEEKDLNGLLACQKVVSELDSFLFDETK